jgi:hypothetical protein
MERLACTVVISVLGLAGGASHAHAQVTMGRRAPRSPTISKYLVDKLIKGKKRHILVYTLGLLLMALVRSASIQDRDGGVRRLSKLAGRLPSIRQPFADRA